MPAKRAHTVPRLLALAAFVGVAHAGNLRERNDVPVKPGQGHIIAAARSIDATSRLCCQAALRGRRYDRDGGPPHQTMAARDRGAVLLAR